MHIFLLNIADAGQAQKAEVCPNTALLGTEDILWLCGCGSGAYTDRDKHNIAKPDSHYLLAYQETGIPCAFMVLQAKNINALKAFVREHQRDYVQAGGHFKHLMEV